MDAKTFDQTFGRDASRHIAEKIGVSWHQYYQFIYGRVPSRKIAWRMHWASKGLMAIDKLLPPAEGEEASQYQ